MGLLACQKSSRAAPLRAPASGASPSDLYPQTACSSADGRSSEKGTRQGLGSALHSSKEQREIQGQPPILLVQPAIWPAAAEFVRRAVPGVHVLSLNEIPEDKRIRVVGSVSC